MFAVIIVVVLLGVIGRCKMGHYAHHIEIRKGLKPDRKIRCVRPADTDAAHTGVNLNVNVTGPGADRS